MTWLLIKLAILIHEIIEFLTKLIAAVNVPMNAVGKNLFGFIAVVPGWLSNAMISAVAGALMILLFKYTSNQKAIGKIKDAIKVNMLALKLFKDNLAVTFTSIGGLFKAASMKLVFALLPMVVMIIPITFILGQMGVWYQARPLLTGEEANVIVRLNGSEYDDLPEVTLTNSDAFETTMDGFKIPNKRELIWTIRAGQDGLHKINFEINGQTYDKELAIGEGFMRVSEMRPGIDAGLEDLLLHPMEPPFGADSIVKSIAIEYPDRISKTSGTNWWLGYFFVISMIFAFIFMPVFKVKI